MPAKDNEAALIRRKTSDTITSLPDTDVDLLFDVAEAEYAGYSRRVVFQAVVVARREELWMASTSSVTYQQNETRENLSDMAKQLKDAYLSAKAALAALIKSERTTTRIGGLKRVPSNDWEFPG